MLQLDFHFTDVEDDNGSDSDVSSDSVNSRAPSVVPENGSDADNGLNLYD